MKSKTTIKERLFKHWITSVFGVILMGLSVGMFLLNHFKPTAQPFTVTEMVTVAVLGWVFMMAKTSLLEGIFLGLFKISPGDKQL